MKKILFLGILLSSCGVPQADYDNLVAENVRLESELDALKNGEEKLAARITQAFDKKEFGVVKSTFSEFENRFPESPKLDEFNALMLKVDAEEKAAQARIEAENQEKERLANLDNTGIWQVSYYVDEFGEKTKDGLVRNRALIEGRFSNTATENSDLNVRLLIDGPKEVDVVLYEYGGNNPVKAYSPDSYLVMVQGNDGKRHELKAVNLSDRLSFGPKHSNLVYDVLKSGGNIKFRITDIETPTTRYAFEIKDAKYFDNAVRLQAEGAKN